MNVGRSVRVFCYVTWLAAIMFGFGYSFIDQISC